jgi:aryl-alcohol dehydrogenase-like predicted oxidoreductase
LLIIDGTTVRRETNMPVAEPADRRAGPRAGLAGTIDLAGELSVNRLGFGAMRIPGIWGDPEAAPVGHRLLRRAIELGVNFIDTAHAYGVSEQRIGEALFPYQRDLVVATKCGYERNADGRPETIRTQVARSLELLRLERIELLQLHTVDPAVPIEESVGAMVELQDQGKVRLIGVSNVSVEELARARAVGEIVSVQNRYSLGDRRSEDVLAVCEQNGIAFLPYFPLAAGVLVQAQETPGRGDLPPRNRGPGGPRLAAPALPSDAADPRHLIARAPGGERGRGRAPPVTRGVPSTFLVRMRAGS